MKNLFLLFSFCFLSTLHAQQDSLTLSVAPNTFWWTGVINDGSKMPLTRPYERDFRPHNQGNQVQPLLLSNQGDVVWSDQAFAIRFTPGSLKLSAPSTTFQHHKAGKTLREAYQYASKTYFPPSGKMPDPLLFTSPQYNTWIELMYNQNQKDILAYARNIVASGSPVGVLMIDDNWQDCYGKWQFHPTRFPNPKAMMDTLHQMGFKVMLWVCPFVSPDTDLYRALKAEKLFVTDESTEPARVLCWI
jgi:alpha-glucosidase (family GH31 glycosyl hydrolase)